MRKDQREELRRLEEALLEAEPREDTDRWLEEYYEEDIPEYRAYNTDTTDVDMESFSDAVMEPPRKRGCLGFVIALLTVTLLALVGVLLYMLGVIP